MLRRLSPIVLAAILPAIAQAEDGHDNHDDHGAHEHGAAEVYGLLAGDKLDLRLTLTGGDLFGHGDEDHDEHDHEDDHDDHDDHDDDHAEHDDEAMLEEATALLTHAEDFIALPEAAGCEMTAADISQSAIEDGEHEGHSDFTALYTFACAAPEALTSLTATALDRGTDLEEIAVVMVLNGTAVTGTLTHEAESLDLTGGN